MTVGTEKSRKMTVPERTRGESSPTALKAVAEKRELTHYIQGSGGRQEGSATLIKEKDQQGRGIEDEGQKKGSSAGTHGQRWEAWKTAGSCGVTESDSSSTDRSTFTVRVFGVTVGTCPQCCNGDTFRPPI